MRTKSARFMALRSKIKSLLMPREYSLVVDDRALVRKTSEVKEDGFVEDPYGAFMESDAMFRERIKAQFVVPESFTLVSDRPSQHPPHQP